MAAKKNRRGLLAVAVFKLVKAALFIAATIGLVHLFHKNVAAHVESSLDSAGIDSDRPWAAAALWRLRLVHTHELKLFAALSTFYSALFLTEGIGLATKQRWAEYLTLVATGLFIPVEIYEVCKQASIAKAVLLLINCAVVAYLAFVVRQKRA